jgi:hypothetical protein
MSAHPARQEWRGAGPALRAGAPRSRRCAPGLARPRAAGRPASRDSGRASGQRTWRSLIAQRCSGCGGEELSVPPGLRGYGWGYLLDVLVGVAAISGTFAGDSTPTSGRRSASGGASDRAPGASCSLVRREAPPALGPPTGSHAVSGEAPVCSTRAHSWCCSRVATPLTPYSRRRVRRLA